MAVSETVVVVASLVTARFFAVLVEAARLASVANVAVTELVAPTPRAVLAMVHEPVATVVLQLALPTLMVMGSVPGTVSPKPALTVALKVTDASLP